MNYEKLLISRVTVIINFIVITNITDREANYSIIIMNFYIYKKEKLNYLFLI